jgi:putative redox protein
MAGVLTPEGRSPMDQSMVKLCIEYLGNLRCEVTHPPSGQTFLTDAPLDNQGKGEAISPTDLCAAALGSCLATILGIEGRKLELDLTGVWIEVDKTMTRHPPRRIARLDCQLWFPRPLEANHQQQLRAALERCPVRESLHPDIEIHFQFHWA